MFSKKKSNFLSRFTKIEQMHQMKWAVKKHINFRWSWTPEIGNSEKLRSTPSYQRLRDGRDSRIADERHLKKGGRLHDNCNSYWWGPWRRRSAREKQTWHHKNRTREREWKECLSRPTPRACKWVATRFRANQIK